MAGTEGGEQGGAELSSRGEHRAAARQGGAGEAVAWVGDVLGWRLVLSQVSGCAGWLVCVWPPVRREPCCLGYDCACAACMLLAMLPLPHACSLGLHAVGMTVGQLAVQSMQLARLLHQRSRPEVFR